MTAERIFYNRKIDLEMSDVRECTVDVILVYKPPPNSLVYFTGVYLFLDFLVFYSIMNIVKTIYTRQK